MKRYLKNCAYLINDQETEQNALSSQPGQHQITPVHKNVKLVKKDALWKTLLRSFRRFIRQEALS